MSSKPYALGDLIEKWIDNRGKTPPLANEGIPLLEVKNLPASGIYPITEGTKYVDQETYNSWFRAYLEPLDILFSTVGTTARVIMTPENRTVAIAQNVLGIRFKKEILDPWYMFYYMRGSKFQHDIKSRLITTVQASIKRADMVGIEVDVPPLSVQKSIVEKVYGLDRKVELNHQINQTLEQMSQAIFKSWFVDFEPVKAKIAALEAGGSEEDALLAAMRVIAGDAQESAHAAEGAMPEAAKGDKLTRLQTEQPEQYAQLRATAELFPSAMQESKLGEIPEGWAARDLKSSTTEIRRGISPKYTENGGIQVLNQKCIRSHKINFVLARRNDSSKRKIDGREIQIGDVLVNSTGVGTLGRLAPVRFLPEPSVTDSHVTVVRANTRLISKAFLAGLMLSSEPFIEASGAGSTGQTELRKQVLEDIMFAMPSLELSATYETIVSPMGQQIACLEEQLTSLARTRDSLLPKLLSGELSVSETESGPTGSEETANF